MEPTTRLWAVLDYGIAGLSREESENANKDIVQVIEDIRTLKAKADWADEIIDDLDGILDYWNKDRNDSAMFDALNYIENWGHDALAKAKDLK